MLRLRALYSATAPTSQAVVVSRVTVPSGPARCTEKQIERIPTSPRNAAASTGAWPRRPAVQTKRRLCGLEVSDGEATASESRSLTPVVRPSSALKASRCSASPLGRRGRGRRLERRLSPRRRSTSTSPARPAASAGWFPSRIPAIQLSPACPRGEPAARTLMPSGMRSILLA